MSKHVQLLVVFVILAVTILACALPGAQPTQSSGTDLPPALPDPKELGTAVAMTLTALAPPEQSPTASAVPSATQEATVPLPRSLHYLAPDGSGITQVFRLERDGVTRQQLTSEPINVSDYDVSLYDGSVVYVADNQLLQVNIAGADRRVLVDGGPVDPINPFINTLGSPVASYDGKTIAYSYKGLQMYSFETDKSRLLIANQIDDAGNGVLTPKELYSPERYSFDGLKLLVTLSYYEGASSAIYYPATEALVRLDGGQGAVICCDDVEWSYDNLSLYAASPTRGMFNSGLWQIDAATGKVTTLVESDAGGGSYNLADEAYLASDGQLYFFFATAPSPDGMITRSPLQLVRSGPDGVTGRTLLSPQDFRSLNEALWDPDGRLVVVALAPSPEIFQGGEVRIIYLDGRPNVTLVSFAQQMKWGT